VRCGGCHGSDIVDDDARVNGLDVVTGGEAGSSLGSVGGSERLGEDGDVPDSAVGAVTGFRRGRDGGYFFDVCSGGQTWSWRLRSVAAAE